MHFHVPSEGPLTASLLCLCRRVLHVRAWVVRVLERHVHDFLVRIDEAVAHFGERAERTLAFCISSITCGSSTPGTPCSNWVARSAALCCVWLTESMPCFSTSRTIRRTPATAPPTGGSRPRRFRAAPPFAACARMRGSGEHAVDFHLAHVRRSRVVIRPRELRRRLRAGAQACSAGARADAERLGHFAAIAVTGAQRFEDQIAFGCARVDAASELPAAPARHPAWTSRHACELASAARTGCARLRSPGRSRESARAAGRCRARARCPATGSVSSR